MTTHRPAAEGYGPAVEAWGTPAFAPALARALGQSRAAVLELARRQSRTGLVAPEGVETTILRCRRGGHTIEATVGVFYREMLAGCSCGEEAQDQEGYCEIAVRIDCATSEAELTVPG